MPVPRGFTHTAESRKRISEGLLAAHAEGRHRWSPQNVGPYSKLASQQRIRRKLLDELGGKCVRCGFDDWRALQVDHINGNGRHDRHNRGNTRLHVQVVAASPDQFQLLCANCNWVKRYEQNEHGNSR